MEYIRNQLDFQIKEPTVITLGKFDGLHRGHELLMENLFAKGKETGYKTMVFTFDIPPGRQEGLVLTTNGEKRLIFERTGVDVLFECPFTPEIMHMEPEEFIRWIVEAFQVRFVVAGSDFRFGHNRAGDYHTLLNCGEQYGYEVLVLDKMKEDGRDISSTFVREEIGEGNIEKANHLLGYPFFAQGTVVHGSGFGHELGIPTVNLSVLPEKLLPKNGVYASRVHLGEEEYPAVTNVGCKPTVSDGAKPGIETHLIGYDGDLYGRELIVEFFKFLRPEKKFSSVGALRAQMDRDIQFSMNYYKNITKQLTM